MNGLPWALDEIETLRALDASGMPPTSIAAILDRSLSAVKSKLAGVRGKGYRQTKRGPAPGDVSGREYETPTPVQSDCHKHISLILRAHRAGFPVCGGSR